jgi:hypothetical protein
MIAGPLWRWIAVVAALAWLAGCATPPPVEVEEEPEPAAAPEPAWTPMVEYPPIEPVEPVEPPEKPPEKPPAPAAGTVVPAPPAPVAEPGAVTPPVAAPPEVPTDEQQLAALVADLQRYNALGPDDLRREIAAVTQAVGRQRTDANRVRLAVLYTLLRTPQDDLRALQLFENVANSNPGSPAVKRLAAVLQVQVAERARIVRDERQKAAVVAAAGAAAAAAAEPASARADSWMQARYSSSTTTPIC